MGSLSEELEYWKDKAKKAEAEAAEVKEEFAEYQEGSRELEAELEAQCEQMEKKNKDLKALNNRIQMENEQLKDKLEQCHQEYNSRITDLQTELTEIRTLKEQLHKYVRELEQQNDDLERAKRSTVASLEDFEIRMNAAIERNVYLESELDEKEVLKAAVQRLKDETKDLRSELKILAPDNDKAAAKQQQNNNNNSLHLPSSSDSNRLEKENGDELPDATTVGEAENNGSGAVSPSSIDVGSLPSTPTKREKRSSTSSNDNAGPPPLTPSARISALNIVGDLLRKVGALELKLVSCRNIVKENQHNNNNLRSNGTTGSSNDILHRLPRVASTPAVKDAAAS